MEHAKIVRNLYSVFGDYSLEGMHYCQCGCTDKADVDRLMNKKLEEIDDADLIPYHGSALYTWGDLSHYKYYLPRIFELYSIKGVTSEVDLYDISQKFEYAKWLDWPAEEVGAIKEFIKSDWISKLKDADTDIDVSLLKEYSYFIEPDTLLQIWSDSSSENARRKLVNFFYSSGSSELYGKSKVPGYNKALIEFASSAESHKLLEKEFFKWESSDSAYAEQISFVLNLFETITRQEK